MANCALWVRTTRHIETHNDDLDVFEDACRQVIGQDNLGGILVGDDCLVYAVRYEGGPDTLLRLLEPALREARFEDWCAVEIGRDFSCSRLDLSDDDLPFGASLYAWGAALDPPNTYGAKALFIDLIREREDRDRFIELVAAKLPGPVSRLWHGRSSILLAFHDRRGVGEIAKPLAAVLDAETDVAEWCLFELGSRCASRTNLSGMSSFLDANYRQAKGLPAAQRPARAPARMFRDRSGGRSAFPVLRERGKR